MAVVYAVSEFTDEKGTDWKVKIVDGTIGTGDLNHAFTLGPDGFRILIILIEQSLLLVAEYK